MVFNLWIHRLFFSTDTHHVLRCCLFHFHKYGKCLCCFSSMLYWISVHGVCAQRKAACRHDVSARNVLLGIAHALSDCCTGPLSECLTNKNRQQKAPQSLLRCFEMPLVSQRNDLEHGLYVLKQRLTQDFQLRLERRGLNTHASTKQLQVSGLRCLCCQFCVCFVSE